MKIGIAMRYVIEGIAQSIIIIVTIIISIIVITNTITTNIQASAYCKWQMFLSQRSSIYVTEQAC